MRKAVALGSALACLSTAAWAAEGPVLKPDDICTKAEGDHPREVDKALFAMRLLDYAGVPRSVEVRASAGSPLSTAELTLSDDTLCAEKCEKGALEKLVKARSQRNLILGSYPAIYTPVGVQKPEDFFKEGGAKLICTPAGFEKKAEPVTLSIAVTELTPFDWKNVRVRGDASSLIYAPNDAITKTVEKASLSFSDDGVKRKSSEKLIGVLAYDFTVRPFGQSSETYTDSGLVHLLPYVGVRQDFSKTSGKGQDTTTSSYNFGVSAYTRLKTFAVIHVLGVRPDYVFDTAQHFNLVSLDASYTPVLGGVVNSWIGPVDLGPLSFGFQPLLDFHVRPGWYPEEGKPDPTLPRRDFGRLGPKFGFALSNRQITGQNIILSVTDYHLLGWKGTPRDVDYFLTTLSIPLLKDGLVAVDLTYGNGRKDDTYKRTQTWQAALSARY